LHRGDDLAGDAELGEVAEARLAVRAKVADRLVEAEEPLLDQVVGVAAEQEVRRRLQSHEAAVAPDDAIVRVGAPALGERDEIRVLKLRWSFWPASRGNGRTRRNDAGELVSGGRCGHRIPPFGRKPWRPYLPWAPSP